MIITRKSLPRRTFLRGLGTTLALPLLDSMVPALAKGGTKPVVRLGIRLPCDRHDHGSLDSRHRGHRVRIHPYDEGAGAVPRPNDRLQRTGASKWPRARRWSRRSRSRRRHLPDRSSSKEDRGRRNSLRHLGGPDCRERARQAYAAWRRSRSVSRARVWPVVAIQDIAAHIRTRFPGAARPLRCRSKLIRAVSSNGCSAMATAPIRQPV